MTRFRPRQLVVLRSMTLRAVSSICTTGKNYRLTLRKALFHGVQAIRLDPVGGSNMYGRSGILAHPYMLGPDGQSNGCVSLQDYHKFLEAFLRGDIDRLIVLPSSGAASARAAGDKQYASQ